jgi:putative ABC transport system permease protein
MKRRDEYARLRRLLGRDALRDEVRDEFEYHLSARVEEYMGSGMTRAEALEEALKRMGDLERYRRETQAIDAQVAGAHRRREYFDGVRRESRQAIRSLVRNPVFALVAVITLALGLGSTGSIWALLDGVVLRPLPYPSPERLVWVSSYVSGGGSAGPWGLSSAGYFYYRANQRTLEDIAVYSPFPVNVSGDAEAERVDAVQVSGGLLPILGARPAVGRLFTEADDAPGAAGAVILSHAFWVRRYGSDRGIVGRTIELNTTPVEVVGVLAEGVQLPIGSADIWLTLHLNPAGPFQNAHYLNGIARLKAGETVETARRDLERLTSQFTQVYPEVYREAFMREYGFRVELHTLESEVLAGTAKTLWILLAAVGLVLVIAFVNVANLFFVRAEVRRRESSVRAALGAERRHLVWHWMVEALLITGMAAVAGILLAVGSIALIRRYSPGGIPRLDAVHPGGSLIAGVVVLAVIAGVVLGLLPQLKSGGGPAAVLREGGRGTSVSRKRQRVRQAMVATQIALAVTLLAAAGLLVRSFEHLRNVDPGFDPAGVLTMSLALPGVRYPDAASVAGYWEELTTRVESIPGVEKAGLVSSLPTEGGPCALVFVEDHPLPPGELAPCLTYYIASPGYFEAMGIAIDGRTPDWPDERSKTGAIVVSRGFADLYWKGETAQGRGIKPNNPGEPWYRIVGVTGQVRTTGLDAPAGVAVYYPITAIPGASLWGVRRGMSMVVKVQSGPVLALLPAIRRVVADLDSDVPLANITTMESILAGSIARRTFAMMLLAIAAAMALLLSAVGIYGVVSYVVGQRRGEIGIRMALGARAASVSRMVIVQSLRIALAGVAIGLILAVIVTRTLSSLLFEVSPSDPATLLTVSLVLIGITTIASWAPARRAAAVDPLEVMRTE